MKRRTLVLSNSDRRLVLPEQPRPAAEKSDTHEDSKNDGGSARYKDASFGAA